MRSWVLSVVYTAPSSIINDWRLPHQSKQQWRWAQQIKIHFVCLCCTTSPFPSGVPVLMGNRSSNKTAAAHQNRHYSSLPFAYTHRPTQSAHVCQTLTMDHDLCLSTGGWAFNIIYGLSCEYLLIYEVNYLFYFSVPARIQLLLWNIWGFSTSELLHHRDH